MRRWYFRALAAGALVNSGTAAAQESRPIPETIRIRPVEDAPRSLPRNIFVLPADIVADPSVLSLPRAEVPKPDPSLPALTPVDYRQTAEPPLVMPAPGTPSAALPNLSAPPAPPMIEVPALDPPPFDRSRSRSATLPVDGPKSNDPGLLPPLEGGLPALPTPRELPPPRTPADQSMPHAAPGFQTTGAIVIPPDPGATAKVDSKVPAGPPSLAVPSTGPRKPFWDPAYDPMRDGDPVGGAQVLLTLDRAPRAHWYFEADYLQWFMPRGRIPALLYGGLPSNQSTPANPLLGRTFAIEDSGGGGSRTTPGLNFTLGTWFEPNYRWGLQVSVMTIFDRGSSRSYASPGDMYLLQPYVDAATGAPSFGVVAGGGVAGAVGIDTRQSLNGQEITLLHALRDMAYGNSVTTVNLLLGYRRLEFRDSLAATTQSVSADGNTYTAAADRFDTWSEFNGGQIGVEANWQYGRLAVDFTGKVALGGTTQNSTISGSTISYNGTTGFSAGPGGFYAQTTNIGTYQRQRLAFVPEVGLKLSYQITPHLVADVGYNFLYISSVIRAGDQVDPVINPNNGPFGSGAGPARPAFMWKGDDLWAQGITLGMTFQY